jgi:hypothetical protein
MAVWYPLTSISFLGLSWQGPHRDCKGPRMNAFQSPLCGVMWSATVAGTTRPRSRHIAQRGKRRSCARRRLFHRPRPYQAVQSGRSIVSMVRFASAIASSRFELRKSDAIANGRQKFLELHGRHATVSGLSVHTEGPHYFCHSSKSDAPISIEKTKNPKRTMAIKTIRVVMGATPGRLDRGGLGTNERGPRRALP